MSNQKLHLGLAAVVLSSIMILAVAIPAASALTPRTDFTDRHTTERFPGGQKVCGDHICTAAEWSQMKKSLHEAQRNSGECAELKQLKTCEPAAPSKSGQK